MTSNRAPGLGRGRRPPATQGQAGLCGVTVGGRSGPPVTVTVLGNMTPMTVTVTRMPHTEFNGIIEVSGCFLR